MDKEKGFAPPPEPSDDLYEDEFSVASSTECTGLGIIIPKDEDEAEAYKEIYNIPLQGGDPREEKS